jgi:hypothetical protein
LILISFRSFLLFNSDKVSLFLYSWYFFK